ncbi:MAG: c-type cytochrome [Gammaproteobacteria bacterium]|nr:c-type cytochrome [Gammaproteobacteria bacterium]NNF60990.1 c-type cytochrome [Gammaproteobacteria bacterium]NNM21096.1 c-type cytochrome [Gammaproteobacteria bacterium]
MRLVLLVIGVLSAAAAQGLPWSKDMVDQPSVKPQETAVREPQGSVPVKGKEAMPVPQDVAEVVRSRLLATRTLSNPVAVDEASVARGKEVYDIHCSVCHGASGKGDGPVGKKFVPPPMDLSTDYVQLQGDGQIFYTITHGGVAMPFYRDAIDKIDRWHIINYIKSELKAQ